MLVRALFFLLFAQATAADSVVPVRTIRANAVIGQEDVVQRKSEGLEGYARVEDVIGQEARVVLYAGRPIRIEDVGPPALVNRNQLIRLAFFSNGLKITTEARALERGAIGDTIRVMNLSSRLTVIGRVQNDGSVHVSP